MVAHSPRPTGILAFQRTFLLLPVAFEYRRIQIQTVPVAALRKPFHHPLRHRFKETLHFPHAKPQKQIPDRVIAGKTVDSQQPMQRPVASQQLVCANRRAPAATEIKNAM